MSITDIVTGEMLLLPGVERLERGSGDFELRVGGKTFAHFHANERIDARLPPDLKEAWISQGLVTRSPELHDREGWVVLRLQPFTAFSTVLKVLHSAYKHVSSTL